ncbi:MAG TPA: hypothetical protein VGN16_11450 [Acidobacteriaceae bacterium]
MASNLVWVFLTLLVLGSTWWGIRRGAVRLPAASALTLALLICILLLPVISISDDLMEARQAALPVSSQTWRMASEGAAVGLELLSMVGACLLLLVCFAVAVKRLLEGERDRRPQSVWLAHTLGIRPPPVSAL